MTRTCANCRALTGSPGLQYCALLNEVEQCAPTYTKTGIIEIRPVYGCVKAKTAMDLIYLKSLNNGK